MSNNQPEPVPPVRISAATGKPLPTPDECTTMDDLRSLHIHALAKLVHIIVGDGGRCMCGMYDDVAMDCPHILAMHDEWIASGLIELIPQQLSEKGGDAHIRASRLLNQAPEVTKWAASLHPATFCECGHTLDCHNDLGKCEMYFSEDQTVCTCQAFKVLMSSPQQPPPAETEPTQQQVDEVVKAWPGWYPDGIARWHLRETASLRNSLDESRAECEKWKSELSHISENLCGTKVEGEVSHEYVYAFVEGEIEKQYELRCEMEEWFSKAHQNATGAPLTLFGKAECQKAVDDIMSYVEKDRQQLTTLRAENERLRTALEEIKSRALDPHSRQMIYKLAEQALAAADNHGEDQQ
jgi:hypothetical protein